MNIIWKEIRAFVELVIHPISLVVVFVGVVFTVPPVLWALKTWASYWCLTWF